MSFLRLPLSSPRQDINLHVRWAGEKAVYKLLFRQTAGTYLDPVSKWKSVNSDKPDGPNYSILNKLDNSYKGKDGKFTFKLVWPLRSGDNHNIWKQSTNPVTETTKKVAGYEAIDVKFTSQNWGGLESGYLHGGATPNALLDGSVNHAHWFYAVGSRVDFNGGMPGASHTAEKKVELYVLSSQTGKKRPLRLLCPCTCPPVHPSAHAPGVAPSIHSRCIGRSVAPSAPFLPDRIAMAFRRPHLLPPLPSC